MVQRANQDLQVPKIIQAPPRLEGTRESALLNGREQPQMGGTVGSLHRSQLGMETGQLRAEEKQTNKIQLLSLLSLGN